MSKTGPRMQNNRFWGRNQNKRKKLTLKKVNAKVNKLKKDEEVKFSEAAANFTLNDGEPQQVLLNGMNQGITEQDRIGNKVRSKKLQMNGYILLPASFNQDVQLRTIIFWDKQANGTVPSMLTLTNGTVVGTPSGLLQNTFLSETTLSFHNTDTVPERYHVIYDKTHRATPTAAIGAVPDSIPAIVRFQKNFKLRDKEISYIGVDDTIVSIGTNSLWCLCCVDAVDGDFADGQPQCNIGFRYSYVDD